MTVTTSPPSETTTGGWSVSNKPRYYTVNITVENEDGEQYAVWRTDQPFTNVEVAMERAVSATVVLSEELELDFDRMDDA